MKIARVINGKKITAVITHSGNIEKAVEDFNKMLAQIIKGDKK